jgi:hypothetical protein
LAVLALVSLAAGAVEVIDAVFAVSVLARFAPAVINVGLAVAALETSLAQTLVAVDQVFAFCSVSTGIGAAFVQVDLAQMPGEPLGADAGEAADFILAGAAVQADAFVAFVDVVLGWMAWLGRR